MISYIVKKGQKNLTTNSIHYKLVLEFDKEKVEMLESKKLMPAQKNVEFPFPFQESRKEEAFL